MALGYLAQRYKTHIFMSYYYNYMMLIYREYLSSILAIVIWKYKARTNKRERGRKKERYVKLSRNS